MRFRTRPATATTHPVAGLLACVIGLAPLACEDRAPEPPPISEPSATDQAEGPPSEGNALTVDRFGNLRGTGAFVLGFELPAGSERRAEGSRGPVVSVRTTEERLLRFFRSRGHQIIETLTGWRIEHTERTLREREDAPREAVIRLAERPGQRWTLRFDDGEPVEVADPPLLELIAAEQEQGDSAPSPSPDTDAAADDPSADPAGGRDRPTARRAGSAGRPDLRHLRRRALERRVDSPRVRDISREIYEYAKDNPDRGFLD